jgi:hypothetical protein
MGEKDLDDLRIGLSHGAADEPPIHELVENPPHDVKSDKRGSGCCLRRPICRDEEISDLMPVGCGKGMRASMAYAVDDFKTPKDLRESQPKHHPILRRHHGKDSSRSDRGNDD